jgi:ABC-type uncharacterized transport system auxiliary subunit
LIGFVLVLAGCTQSPPPKSDTFYRLDVPRAEKIAAEPPINGILEVSRLDVDGVVSQRSLAYVDERTPINVQSYRYELWVDAPGALVQGELVDYFREANLARTVLTPDTRAIPDFTLRGRIKRFEQVISSAGAHSAVEIEFSLSARDGRLLLLRRYEASAPAAATTPQAAVPAIAQAVAKIAADLTRDLAAAAGPGR